MTPPARRSSLVGVATYGPDDALSAFAPPLTAGAFEAPPIGTDAAGRTSGVQRVPSYARRAYAARP